ncbi:hypothetical protein O6H91_01G017900 [Diphasiastrum complanatum]|nr:hypothetical protein O6H91_01G017900 [Diphasiastrum complanatum]
MYGDCGSIAEAVAVFDNLVKPNLHSWTILMKAYAENGLTTKAIKCFHQMRLHGIQPDQVTFVCALNACACAAALEEGQDFHAAIVERGYETDVVVGTALIHMYGKCGRLAEAQWIFCKLPNKDLIAWNSMMSACVQNGHDSEALELFDYMQYLGFAPNTISFVCALDACGGLASLQRGQEIHAAILHYGCEAQVIVGTALVNMYGKCGRLQDARRVFNQMQDRDLVCWNTMIAACTQNGHCEIALDLFHCMQCDGMQTNLNNPNGIQPNPITFISVLDACASLGCLDKGQQIHAAIIEGKHEGHIFVSNAIINMYGKCGSLEDAKRVFGQMSTRDVVSWNTIIAACSQNGQGKEALEFFHAMQSDGFKPDEATFVCALDACSSLIALEKGHEIHSAVIDYRYEESIAVASALVHMYGKCGDLKGATSVFGSMPNRDVIAWNSMISACTQNGHDKEALARFCQMQHDGIRPNQVTFLSILSACSHMGWVEHGWHYFTSMSEELGLEHTVEHYVCLIDILGRSGHLGVAEDLINTMPFENKSSMWLCLLGACKVHADVERGMRVASQVLDSDPENAAPYVLLSNIFAAAGRWTDAQKIRVVLKNWSKEEIPKASMLI